MSDGASGNAFGEALESMATNTKSAVGGTIADFTKSAAGQIKGTGGISGSFSPGQPPSAGSFNPNTLSGGDLFSPDMVGDKSQNQSPKPQNLFGGAPLTAAGQQAAQNPEAKSSEDLAKIQQIEQELRSLHQQYYQDFAAKAEGRDKKTQVEQQEKEQEKQEEKMQDLQQKQEKKQQDDALMRAQRGSEIKGGGIG